MGMGNFEDLYQNMFATYKDVVNVKQLAEMLVIGINMAYKLVREKKIKSVKVGREYKIPKSEAIKYVCYNQ